MSKTNSHVSIMDIPFINISQKELLEQYIYPRLDNQQKSYIVTANPEIVMMAKENRSYKQMVMQADFIIPDGTGIVMASKMIKNPIKERMPGFDLMTHLIGYAEDKKLSCYFLGASEQVNNKMVEKLKELHPYLKVAGSHHGFFDLEDRTILEKMQMVQPDFIFVALGSPRQEEWITKYYQEFDKGLFMGVGGSFDVIAGEVKRAPKIWIDLHLEWLYRVIKQPFRWKRILKVFEFMFRMLIRKY
ncbi:WecB/TagA/CpsF family glycosyltransferase [Sediminibacillus albus]|uniref:N-acetylglucosaminyldiphosphoundecaprenol N-acetyl-beta-D-mannosaminyltransferase n=1 Tax=Sediminibacillus albus TaxID=407036 RepID=A0A1G8ZGI3_9BACI|nr:WecB/TagA/CpsF family glycosyltransferase [Sediminibacillus albus]SDK14147.1 N-acetylglucosaminyldiphosphoundecaprenol N-acetyl-beta-D-mannosaminyltransferase [Sediminibacillus albus]